jgi:predicted nucleic-acid-binding Zn-ribbon protein
VQDIMTPEHLEQISSIQHRGIIEFECWGCQTTLIYHASVVHSPLIDGLCDECHQAGADNEN